MANSIFTVSLGFTEVTPAALLDKGRNHVTMLTGNADFPTPSPTTVVLTVACDKLESASNAYNLAANWRRKHGTRRSPSSNS